MGHKNGEKTQAADAKILNLMVLKGGERFSEGHKKGNNSGTVAVDTLA